MVMAAVSLVVGWFLKRRLDRDDAAHRPDSKP
jgi:hypothetical protein